MGAWGHKALESDEGLDVVDLLRDNIPANLEFTLTDVIALMKEKGFFGKDFSEIDFFYDNSAMALAELYIMFREEGKLRYEHEEENKDLARIKAFTADNNSLKFLLKYLIDIKNEVPDEDDEREIVELWKDSDCWEDWQQHLENCINTIEGYIK